MDRASYNSHNSEYQDAAKLAQERAIHRKNSLGNFIYQADIPHGRILDRSHFQIGVDIGAGTGWLAHHLVVARGFRRVYAIEPSQAAIDIARRLYPHQKGVEYIAGFAEEEIGKLAFPERAFFSTLCVFAHLEDATVERTLRAIDVVAKEGSILACSEPWGKEWHQTCWHVRDCEWWQEKLPGWQLEYDADYVLPEPNDVVRYKGFTATKTRKTHE